MENIVKHALMLLVLATSAAAQLATASPADVLIRVGSEVITRSDLENELNRLVPNTVFHSKVPSGRREELTETALEQLVERSLIYQQAVDVNLPVSETEIAEEFDRTLALAGLGADSTDSESVDRLLEQYRPLVVRRILLDKNEARFEASVPAVTDEQVRALFDQRAQDLFAPEESRFIHILKKVAPSAGDQEALAIRRQTEQIQAELSEGGDIAELAREHSDDIYAARGGDMGFVRRGSFLTDAVDRVAFALADGETSGIIATIYGFHIVKRLETRPERLFGYEEAARGLRAELVVTTRLAVRDAWMSELRASYPVEHLEDPTLRIPEADADAEG